MKDFFKKIMDRYFVIAVVTGVFMIAFLGIVLSYSNSTFVGLSHYFYNFSRTSPSDPASVIISGEEEMKRFSSEEEFKKYLEESPAELGYSGFVSRGELSAQDITISTEAPGAVMEKSYAPERVSETTVQVSGIDEPDIVKTNGKEIYFSPGYVWRGLDMPSSSEIMPYPKKGRTNIINAFPPAELSLEANIDESGDLLLADDILMVFSGRNIFGYDISEPRSPEKKWDINIGDNHSIVEARLYKDKIYLVTKSRTDIYHPCPIKPLETGGEQLIIRCQEIYHPVRPISADITFVVMTLDPISGKVENKISFVGSSGSSVVYMSEKAIYATYPYYESVMKFFSDFFQKECQDIIPMSLIGKIKKLESYDISQQAKLLEFEVILEQYFASLDNDEKLRIENELSNRMAGYYEEHKRDMEKTGIVKIGADDLEIKAVGSVPGRLLNQFALDEYKDNLRAAVTIGERWGFAAGVSRGGSANDVYVLDNNLKIQGSVKDMGLTEKIYSVRFVEDKGYVVTFRQIDPFYVLDLSDPKKPVLKGELKIPGYSSYLHPISEDMILGIGKEGWQIKISLFDVSSPTDPKESDKYILDESWSDILSTHHAFLLDNKHNIFFLPGQKGGYIFSYQNGKLKLVKAIDQVSVRRAIYINDYLYIIGDTKISVLNETDWERVNDLNL